MKILLKIVGIGLLGLFLGIVSLLVLFNFPLENTVITNGPWQTDLSIGSSQTGIYARARVALIGLFAFKRSEVVYYIAKQDSDGRPLNSKHIYRIEGKDLDTKWWSITIVGWNFFLIPNVQKRYSYNWARVVRNRDRSYTIRLSEKKRKGNWLPTGGGTFYINLRLYRPGQSVHENPGNISLPRIIREK